MVNHAAAHRCPSPSSGSALHFWNYVPRILRTSVVFGHLKPFSALPGARLPAQGSRRLRAGDRSSPWSRGDEHSFNELPGLDVAPRSASRDHAGEAPGLSLAQQGSRWGAAQAGCRGTEAGGRSPAPTPGPRPLVCRPPPSLGQRLSRGLELTGLFLEASLLSACFFPVSL
jgi:hypothetical protein